MSEVNTAAAAKSGSHMVRGSAWAVALRWCIRGTGLLSTLILARLLTPADFGIIAMAMLVVGALEILRETGQKLAIIRHPDPTREHYDSAWTMSILIGLALSAGIFAVAPFTVDYFHEPRAILVIRCLALRALIGGFENIGVVDFRRGLRFQRDFHYALAQKVISFVTTIAAAIILRNYWALVIGILVSRISGVALSYVLHPFRPRICFSKVAELWSFSIWALVKHVGNYFTSKADEFIVGGMGGVPGLPGATAMGRYNVAADVAASPTDELITPVVATLFPVMATIQGDLDTLKRLYLRVLAWSAIVCSCTSVGVALVSDGIVRLVLGPQWLPIKAIMPWIALSQGVLSLGAGVYVVFDVLGYPRYSAIAQWTRFALMVAVLVPLSWQHNLTVIAMGRFAVACVITPTLFWNLRRVLPVRLTEFAGVVWRPMAAAAVMAVAVSAANALLTPDPALRLAGQVLVGAVAYIGTLLLLWQMMGSPSGPEEDVVKWCRRTLHLPPYKGDEAQPASNQESQESLSSNISESRSARPLLRVCLYTPIPRAGEFKSHPRSRLSLAKRKLVRGAYRFAWRYLRTTYVNIRHWIDHEYTNRGDIAIRDTVTERLRSLFPDRTVEFMEIAWGDLSAETIERINQTCDLFVIGGGGFVFFGVDGRAEGRGIDDLSRILQIRCLRVAYGIGINSLLAETGEVEAAPLPVQSLQQIDDFTDCLDLLSVRGRAFHGMASARTDTPTYLIGDPVFVWEAPKRRTAVPSKRDLAIGINFAVHGPKSAETFRTIFPQAVAALRGLQSKHDVRFHYFMHCDTEQIAVEMLQARGIRIERIVAGSPAELSAGYADMDIVICQMLHAAILAMANETPALCLAYDTKNFTFYDLIGCRDLCVSPSAVTSAGIVESAELMLRRHDEVVTLLRLRRQELHADAERFEQALRTLVLEQQNESNATEPARSALG